MLQYHEIEEFEKYTISDWKYEERYSIYNRLSYEEEKKMGIGFADPENHFYSFYDEKTLVGYINLRKRAGNFLLGVGVNPELCGKGYGEKIVRMACEISKKLFGIEELYLEVRTWNERAVRCYEKAGFQIEGEAFCQMTPNGRDSFYRMKKIRRDLA